MQTIKELHKKQLKKKQTIQKSEFEDDETQKFCILTISVVEFQAFILRNIHSMRSGFSYVHVIHIFFLSFVCFFY